MARSSLTPAQEASAIFRRKVIYETIHPETVNGENQHTRVRQIGEGSPADRFTAATAAATGKPERSIQRAAERGAKLGSDLKSIAGTSLDKGVELDALAKMALMLFDEATQGKAGGANNPQGLGGKSGKTDGAIVNVNNVNGDNGARERPQGNSADAGLRRLRKAATPPDLGRLASSSCASAMSASIMISLRLRLRRQHGA